MPNIPFERNCRNDQHHETQTGSQKPHKPIDLFRNMANRNRAKDDNSIRTLEEKNRLKERDDLINIQSMDDNSMRTSLEKNRLESKPLTKVEKLSLLHTRFRTLDSSQHTLEPNANPDLPKADAMPIPDLAGDELSSIASTESGKEDHALGSKANLDLDIFVVGEENSLLAKQLSSEDKKQQTKDWLVRQEQERDIGLSDKLQEFLMQVRWKQDIDGSIKQQRSHEVYMNYGESASNLGEDYSDYHGYYEHGDFEDLEDEVQGGDSPELSSEINDQNARAFDRLLDAAASQLALDRNNSSDNSINNTLISIINKSEKLNIKLEDSNKRRNEAGRSSKYPSDIHKSINDISEYASKILDCTNNYNLVTHENIKIHLVGMMTEATEVLGEHYNNKNARTVYSDVERICECLGIEDQFSARNAEALFERARFPERALRNEILEFSRTPQPRKASADNVSDLSARAKNLRSDGLNIITPRTGRKYSVSHSEMETLDEEYEEPLDEEW